MTMERAVHMMAFDLGASSGRAILGTLEGGRLRLRELHRFSNDPVELVGRLYWDLPRLVYEMKQGLNKAALEGLEPGSIGIDTWGVDYGLLDKAGHLMGNPVHYRDARTDKVMEAAFELVPREELYRRTGLAFLPLNTIYQLYSEVREMDPLLTHARKLLFMPDLLAYLLTGTLGCEYTIASTSQLLSPYTRTWDMELIEKLGIPKRIFLPVTEPGSVRGMLDARIARETGVGVIPVVAVGGHDTASAVAAVPAEGKDFGYISSGTWSLVGVESDGPVISPEAVAANLTNEGGVEGNIRVLKNVMGLWIIQECRREWERRGRMLSFQQIVEEAQKAEPFFALIDPNDEMFTPPGDMPSRVQAFCVRSGQPVPQSVGQIARVIFESLALKYRWTVERLRKVTGNPIRTLHVVGGGANNALLNRFTADALGIPVLAGPSEATAIGNLLMQLKALGIIGSVEEGRALVRASFSVETVEPRLADKPAWDEAYVRFVEEISVE